MWHHSNTIVLNAVSNPSGPLDISSVVGVQECIVLFKVIEAGLGEFGGSRSLRVGTTTSTQSSDYIEFTPFKLSGFVIGITNSSGILPGVSGNEIITLTVVGYSDGLVDTDTIFGPAALGQETVDMSAFITGHSLSIFGWTQTAGSETKCASTHSSDQSDNGIGANTCHLSALEATAITLSPSEFAEIRLFDPNSGVEQVDLIAAIREVDGWNAVISTVFIGTPPVVWTALDLSSDVGDQVSLVLLRVAISPSFEADDQYFAFKSNADATLDYLPSSSTGVGVSAGYANFGSVFYTLVETDATGIVQWIGSPEQTVQIDLFGYVDALVIPDLYIASVTPAALSMRVTFSGPVVNDTELRNPSNYTFTPSLSTNGGIECISVTPQSRVDYPTYVDLEITDCTNRAEYTLAITAHRIQNQGGDFIESDGNTIVYNGVSNPPGILLAVSTSETTYRVVFSKMMAVNADLVNPSKYVFSDGLKCTSVAVENTSSVILTTTKQTLGHVYSLTVG